MGLWKKLKHGVRNRLIHDPRYYLLVEYRRPLLYELGLGIRHRLYGRKIRLDASSVCQLKCLACSTANGMNKDGVVGWGHLDPEHFRRLLDENPDIRAIELSNWGEIFLNPGIVDIMRYAHERGVRLMAANGVNLNTVKEEALEALVKYRFRYLSVSIDGASPETYEQYRIKGNFDNVINNIRRINHYKQVHGTKFPRLAWQFIIFGHNEHELPKAREMCDELGMTLKTKLNHTPTVSPVKDKDYVRREGGFGASSRDEFRETKKKEYSFPCMQMWKNPQINWDGKMLGCCVNKWGDFGDVFEEGLQGVLKGERFTYAKKMILGKVPPRKDQPCVKCKVYQRLNPDAEFPPEEQEKPFTVGLKSPEAKARDRMKRKAAEKAAKQKEKDNKKKKNRKESKDPAVT